jgi:hypothetical protein
MIMPGIIRNSVLLLGALTMSLTGVTQRQTPPSKATTDVAITYVAERAKVASIDCGCFWLEGGSMNAAVTFYRGLGVAANLTGGHASSVTPGVDLDKVSFMMGPRYTHQLGKWGGHEPGQHGETRIFGEGLAGGVHGFNTIFPSSAGVAGAASSFVFQVGGGLDWTIRKNIGIRVVEADYVRSTLPNNGNNTQHDLRLGAGISFHFKN